MRNHAWHFLMIRAWSVFFLLSYFIGDSILSRGEIKTISDMDKFKFGQTIHALTRGELCPLDRYVLMNLPFRSFNSEQPVSHL